MVAQERILDWFLYDGGSIDGLCVTEHFIITNLTLNLTREECWDELTHEFAALLAAATIYWPIPKVSEGLGERVSRASGKLKLEFYLQKETLRNTSSK